MRSFLSSRSPAFAAEISSAYLHGSQIGAEFGMRKMAEDAADKRLVLQEKHADELHAATQNAENARFLLSKQVEGVKETAKTFRDQADKIDSDLQANAVKYTPSRLKLLQGQSYSLRAAAQNADATIAKTFGYNAPVVPLTPPTDESTSREAIYNSDFLQAEKDKVAKEGIDLSNASMQNHSNKEAFVASGGRYATPGEMSSAQNIQSEIPLRTMRTQLLGKRMSAQSNKLTGSSGEALSPREQYAYQSAQSVLPGMWSDYTKLVGAANQTPSGSDQKFKSAASSKLGEIGKAYSPVAEIFFNNADDTVRKTIQDLGLGLTNNTALDDFKKVSDALGSIKDAKDPKSSVLAHISKNLGFRIVPWAQTYTPSQSADTPVPSGGLYDQGW